MQKITFSGRVPMPAYLQVGMEGEHNATTLILAGLPALDDNQTELFNIVLPDGTADTIAIADSAVTLTRDHTPQPGTLTAWVTVQVGTALVWKSETLHLIIGPLPDISDQIEQQYPSALEDAIAQTAASKAGAEAARDAILGMHVRAETLPPGSEATARYSDGEMVLGIPRGYDSGDLGLSIHDGKLCVTYSKEDDEA